MNLEISNLCFSYGKKNIQILNNVSFDLLPGECGVLLGPNGAVKSTIIKWIDGLVKYEDGSIKINNKEVKNYSKRKLAQTIGYVPQLIEFADMTVFDAVLLGRIPYIRHQPSKHDLNVVDRVIHEMNLEMITHKNVNEISGGEQQKVAIARTLAQEPSILLFDEPTSNLDIKNQMEIVNLIKKLAKENNISILVTMHDINLALTFADKFILVKNGNIYGVGNNSIIDSKSIKDVYELNVTMNLIGEKIVVLP